MGAVVKRPIPADEVREGGRGDAVIGAPGLFVPPAMSQALDPARENDV
jgi:hypothetical protein